MSGVTAMFAAAQVAAPAGVGATIASSGAKDASASAMTARSCRNARRRLPTRRGEEVRPFTPDLSASRLTHLMFFFTSSAEISSILRRTRDAQRPAPRVGPSVGGDRVPNGTNGEASGGALDAQDAPQ